MTRRISRIAFFVGLLAAAGCEQTTTATFSVGLEASLTTADFPVPDELREDTATGPVVRSVPCDAVACPSTMEAPVTCVSGTCDPEPLTISAPVGDPVDLDELAGDLDDVIGEIDSLEILEIRYQVQRNTLTIPVEEVEIFWGPAGAASVDSAGVQRLGVVPSILVGTTGEGDVMLDAAGAAAFTEYYENVEHRYRFFIRTGTDLMPGGPFPQGELDVAVSMRVRITGSLL
ncbi:MAG: hypothetical protein JJ863_30865 [Deltaproteobacteria bacterium]|nr:hypothetical protein [Deltaproteobacteria bacterium]